MSWRKPRPTRIGLRRCAPFAGLVRTPTQELGLSFLGELGEDQVAGLTEETFDFRGPECGFVFESDPVGASEIWGGDDAGALDQFGEFLVGAFEGQPSRAGLERHDREHLSADFEEEVVFPLDLFGDAGEREAEFADRVDVHECEDICWLAARKPEKQIPVCRQAGLTTIRERRGWVRDDNGRGGRLECG